MAYTSQYPTLDTSHVKATSLYSGGVTFLPHLACDPAQSLIGAVNTYLTDGSRANNRFHIDLGTAKVIRRVYYENYHDNGGYTNVGFQNFTFWGSNSATAFAELTYGTDTDWTQLTIDDSTLDQHVAANQADPKYILVTNLVAYRYYAFKVADNWGYAPTFMGIRRIELQKEDGIGDSGGGFFMAA